MYQQCKRCIMDTTGDSTITFNDSGFCNYCEDSLRRKILEYFPTTQGFETLKRTFEQIKTENKGKPYDCIAGISGGLDSSYVIYLAREYGLRVLAVHIDDGFNTEIAESNIKNLCAKSGTELIIVKPNQEQFIDLTRSFLKASVPGLAVPQDNIILTCLYDLAQKNKITYNLSGGNFALECILQRGNGINAFDKRHIMGLHKRFGETPIKNLRLMGMVERYITSRYLASAKKVYPLNYIDYNLKHALNTLSSFSEYSYYGGKHFESILTRFLQCYYLPVKYGVDKRKSHLSSMIISGQMTRGQALEVILQNQYPDSIKEHDFNYISNAMQLNRKEFEELISLPAKQHTDYPVSKLNILAGTARKFRRYLG